MNNQLIDGLDNNERLIRTNIVHPSVEGVAELGVQTSNFTAESGRTGGAVVNIITKTGTNQFHGSVFEYLQNDITDAYPYAFGVKLPKSELRQNNFGTSIGGPIVHDKGFFFVDYEGLRSVLGLSPTTSAVPTLYERQHVGDFSDAGGPVLAASALDPAAIQYFQIYPLPNNGTNQYVGSDVRRQKSDVGDVRVDYHFNTNNWFYARSSYNHVNVSTQGWWPNATVAGVTVNGSPFGQGSSPIVAANGLLNFIHTFTPSVLLEAKAGYSFFNSQTQPLTPNSFPNQAFGQPNMLQSGTLAPLLVLSGQTIGGGGYLPLSDLDNVFQYLAAVTWTKGNHNIKVGGGLIRRQLTSSQSAFPNGLWIFLDLPNMLEGNFITLQQLLSTVNPHLRTWEPSAYVQDDWHASPKLTFNVGLRYDVFTAYKEIENRISNFDDVTGQLVVAGVNGASQTANVSTTYSNVAPRLGFAATVLPKTVIKGGYGLTFFPGNTTSQTILRNPPFLAGTGPCGPATGVPCPDGIMKLAQGLPVAVATSATNPVGPVGAALSTDFRTSYLQQFNVSAQREFLGSVATATYVGSLGRHIVQPVPDINAAPPNVSANPQALRPYAATVPNITSISQLRSEGVSSYNALQLAFERRFSAGISFDANYTLAHNLDDALSYTSGSTGGYGAVPSLISTLDYGNSDLDIRQRGSITLNYEVPFGKNLHGVAGVFGKGWQFNVLGAITSGQAYTITNSSDTSNTRPGQSNADRPNLIGKPKLAHPTLQQYFDTSAFQAQAPGTIGALPGSAPGTIGSYEEKRNQLHGPNYEHLDASLMKTFAFNERVGLDFRAESFNLTNTTNFGIPNASLGAAFFGQVTALGASMHRAVSSSHSRCTSD